MDRQMEERQLAIADRNIAAGHVRVEHQLALNRPPKAQRLEHGYCRELPPTVGADARRLEETRG